MEEQKKFVGIALRMCRICTRETLETPERPKVRWEYFLKPETLTVSCTVYGWYTDADTGVNTDADTDTQMQMQMPLCGKRLPVRPMQPSLRLSFLLLVFYWLRNSWTDLVFYCVVYLLCNYENESRNSISVRILLLWFFWITFWSHQNWCVSLIQDCPLSHYEHW